MGGGRSPRTTGNVAPRGRPHRPGCPSPHPRKPRWVRSWLLSAVFLPRGVQTRRADQHSRHQALPAARGMAAWLTPPLRQLSAPACLLPLPGSCPAVRSSGRIQRPVRSEERRSGDL